MVLCSKELATHIALAELCLINRHRRKQELVFSCNGLELCLFGVSTKLYTIITIFDKRKLCLIHIVENLL